MAQRGTCIGGGFIGFVRVDIYCSNLDFCPILPGKRYRCEPWHVAGQADSEGEGRDEEVDEGQEHEAHQLQVGPQHHCPEA